jgi:hypothetical protein
MTDLPFAAAAGALALWLFAAAFRKPRLLTYAIFALAPTQFIFIPVSSFFLSPVDALVIFAGAAFTVRLAGGERNSVTALWRHRYLVLMVAAYLLGFVVLGVFSRTLVRVLMAICPSILACEVLRERKHLLRAAAALVGAGAVDGGYGLALYALGRPMHPTRFSGMSGVNFSAIVIITAAAVGFARSGRARNWSALTKPAALIAMGAATLSQMGAIAFITAWIVVLRRIMTRRNVVRIASVAALAVGLALSSGSVREKLASRNYRQLEVDGVERNSADVRWMVLRAAWKGIEASPFVGIGFAAFPAYSTVDPEIYKSTTGLGYGTHNTYVEVLVEGGLLAFSCLFMHFLQYAAGIRSILKDLDYRKDTVVASALVGLPIVLVAAGLANVFLQYHFWAVCGLALACVQFRQRDLRVASGALSVSRSDAMAPVPGTTRPVPEPVI